MGVTTLEKLKPAFSLSAGQLTAIAGDFRAAMAAGLAGRPSSLKMLPSYLGLPSGREKGEYLALDFGGSNVRALLVALGGDGRWIVRRQTAAPLADPAGGYDYTAATATAEELFDFVAGLIARTADGDKDYLLGHTFSFPCRQTDVGHAVLLGWTKEIRTAGVEGREVNTLLAAALARRGLGRVRPVAVINDTVGTLLAAAYADPAADIAAICGTGHNTCYYDAAKSMIINMESGNFDKLPFTVYDDIIDAASEKPSAQLLEKMAAGRYLGELVRLAAADLAVPAGSAEPTAKDVAGWLADAAAPAELQAIAELVVVRAARLVAATFLGVLGYCDPELAKNHTIAIDGSLYEKMPGYSAALTAALDENLRGAAKVTLRLVKDGSGVGAAIAAAVAR